MAGKIPQGEAITRIGLDAAQPIQTLKSLKSEVSSLTNAWKAQEIQMKSAGDKLGAAQVKYDGLSNSIKKQQDYIGRLKTEQKNIDRTTNEGAESYQKLSSKIETATRRLASMEAQEKRAQSTMRYYQSGLADAKNELTKITTVSNSYVEKLKAQERYTEANVAKLNGLKSQYAQMQVVYQKQATELKKVGIETGKNSDEYAKQTVKLNQLGAKLATTEKEYNALNKSVGGLSPSLVAMSDKITSHNKKMSDFSSKMVNAGHSVQTFSMVSAGALAYGIQKATELQNTYLTTSNLLVTGGEKQAEVTQNVAQMQRDGQGYATKYGESLNNVGKGYQELVKRGYTSSQSLGSMNSILQGTKASGDDFDDVLKVTTGTLEAYGMRINENTGKLATNKEMVASTKKVVNELAYAADMSATDFQSIGKAMEYVGTTAHTSKVSLSETSAVLGVLSNNNIEADKAGTGLRKVLNGLTVASDANSDATENRNRKITQSIERLKLQASQQKEGSKQLATTNLKIKQQTDNLNDQSESAKGAAGALQKMHMQSTDLVDDSGKLKPLSTIFKDMKKHMDSLNMSPTERTTIFNQLFGTTGQEAAIVMSQNADAIKDLDTKVKSSVKDNYVGKLSEKNMKSAQNQMKILKESGSALAEQVGENFLPYLTKAVKGVTGLVKSFGGLPGGAKKFIAFGVGTTAVLAPLLILIGKVTSGIVALNAGAGALIKTMGKSHTKTKLTDAAEDAGELAQEQATTNATTTAPTTAGKAVQTGEKAVKGAGKVGKLLKGAAVLDVGINLVGAGTDIVGALKQKNPDKKFKAYGSGIGATVGTAVGAVFGGPIGAGIGGEIGKVAGKAGGSAAKKFTDGWNKYGTKHKPKNLIEKVGYVSRKSANANADLAIQRAGATAPKSTKKATNPYKGLSKDTQSLLKTSDKAFTDITKSFIKMNSVNKKESEKAGKQETASYTKLTKSLDKYYSGRQKQAKKDLDLLVKNGALTRKQADKQLAELNKSDKRRKTNVEKSYKQIKKITDQYEANRKKSEKKINAENEKTLKQQNKDKQSELDKAEKKYGKNSKKYLAERQKINKKYNNKEVELERKKRNKLNKEHDKYLKELSKAQVKANSELEKSINTSNKKQEKTLDKLSHRKTKLSHDAMIKILEDSQKERDGQIDDAEKTYNKVVKSAKDTYKETLDKADKKRDATINAAKSEYENLGTISKDQYDKIVKEANGTYTESKKSAETKRDDVIDAAATEKKKTVKHAKSMHKNVVKEATEQAGEHKDAVVDEKDNVKKGWEGITAGVKKMIDNIGPNINNMVKAMGFGTGKIQPWQAYKTGTSGTPHDEIAVVGEEGFELAHTPGKGIYPIGVSGEETRYIPQGTSILPHEQSKQFLSMTSTLPHHKDGVLGTMTDWFSDVIGDTKEAMGDLGGMISKGARWVLQRIEDKVGTSDFVKSFENAKGTSKYDVVNGAHGSIIDNAINYLQDFFNKWMAENATGSGSRGDLLKNAIKYSEGKPYVWGAAGPDSFDCSGLVMYTLAQMGVQFPHISGAQFNATEAINESDARPGDLSFYGPGGNEHVGIVAGKNKMWAAQSPNSSPNIGYDTIHNGLPFSGIRRIKQLSDLEGGTYDPAQIKKAAKKMGLNPSDSFISMLQATIQSESGGRNIIQQITDVNSGGNEARGILQYTPPTFNNYAMPGFTNIMDPFSQLIAFFNNAQWQSSIGATNIWGTNKIDWLHAGPKGARRLSHFANGGLATEASIFGEDGAEMAIPMSAVKASRGYELLGKTAASFAARDGLDSSGSDGQVLGVLNRIEYLLSGLLGGSDTAQPSVVLDNQLNIDGKKFADATTKKYILPQIADAVKKGGLKLSGL